MRNEYFEEIVGWEMPLRRFPEELNPFAGKRVEINVLCGYQTPNYVTMKSGMVYWMLKEAQEAGKLEGVTCLVEATSGATGLVLCMLARDERFGIPDVEIVIVMNKDVPDGKRMPIMTTGATVIDPHPGLSSIGTARTLGQQAGWLNLDQYANPANPNAYRDHLGPQLIKKMGSRGCDLMVCPGGTGGTGIGLEQALRREYPRIKMVGAMCAPDESIPGIRSKEQMGEIRLPWQEAFRDGIVEVRALHAYVAMLQIQNRAGMMMGVSSGAAYTALLTTLKEHERAGTLDALRGPDGIVRAMFVAHDGGRTYTANKMPVPDEYIDGGKRAIWELL